MSALTRREFLGASGTMMAAFVLGGTLADHLVGSESAGQTGHLPHGTGGHDLTASAERAYHAQHTTFSSLPFPAQRLLRELRDLSELELSRHKTLMTDTFEHRAGFLYGPHFRAFATPDTFRIHLVHHAPIVHAQWYLATSDFAGAFNYKLITMI